MENFREVQINGKPYYVKAVGNVNLSTGKEKSTLLETIKSHLKQIPVTERLHGDFRITLSCDAYNELYKEYHIENNNLIYAYDEETGEVSDTQVLYKYVVDPIQTKHFDFYNPVASK